MIRHSLVLAGVLGLGGVLTGCQPASQTSSAGDYVQITQPSFVQAWDVQLQLHPGDTIHGLYFLDGTLHVLTNQNYDQAVKGDSGQLLYENQIGSPANALMGGPTLVTGGIVFPTTHTLEVFSRTGTFLRSIDVQYTLTNQIVGNKNDVYAGLDFNKGCLAQVDVTQQIDPVQWTYLTFGPVDGPVAVSEGVIYSGSEDGKVRACLDDRSPSWPLLVNSAFDTQSKVVSGIAVDGHSCYFGTTSGTLYCLDKDSGKVKWQYFAGSSLENTPQVTDSAIYQYVQGTGLVALDKSEKLTLNDSETVDESPFHNPKWTLSPAGGILGEDDQFVYVLLGPPDHPYGVAAADKATGHIKFRTHRRDIVFLAADPKASMMYGVTSRGLLVAFKPVAEPGSYGELVEAASPDLDGLVSHGR